VSNGGDAQFLLVNRIVCDPCGAGSTLCCITIIENAPLSLFGYSLFLWRAGTGITNPLKHLPYIFCFIGYTLFLLGARASRPHLDGQDARAPRIQLAKVIIFPKTANIRVELFCGLAKKA
jgi:hypothetical protein